MRNMFPSAVRRTFAGHVPGRPPARRASAGVALGVGLALAASGCGSNAASDEPAEYAAPDKDLSASITYGVWDKNQVDAIEENIDAFNEEYPNIEVTVNVTPYAEYWTKLQTQASSDTLPDLFWINGPNIGLYASNGKLEPITGAVEAGDIDPANYPEALVDLYTIDDVQYGVPKDMDTIGIWANKALFEKAGVELPSGDWTWDEFQKTATDISTALAADGEYGGAGGMDGQTTYYNTILQAGGTVIEDGKSGYASPETQAGLQFWTDLIASGGSPNIQQLTDTTADQWFTSGKLAMYWGGSWFRSALTDTELEENVVVLPLPQGEKQATVIHGLANVVSAGSKEKQAAQALQAFLASKDAQQQQGDAGAVIPAFEGTQSAFTGSMPNANLQIFLDALDYAQPLPVSKNSAAWNALETDLLPQAFSGEQPVEKISADLATQMDAALAEE
ncbi:sugar ABC transporter substrate-binding protein [Arthrobacter sp. zg-Y20]|uniref:ABC transporter substrate-binding protein n=1 Tax=unclassified Arthrobacter TaxID=235627 RepID=UPI001D148B98|nr:MULTISPECIES: sugar ABC transporter substrate-binding protein [unclassified Arthrobacter]MCC3275365.1 sugar ABC transporter substrate-binding protein [Arthrobacter sp. zg-Y20]MDK1315524.1 sugar ABC transporter substrate-binding protein [Arthrobacter sp. zg.Y20]WIB05939.1 sugar ABC transporter substrate-binding protein [Arthrobacter sp. zg-Y20]